MPPKKSISPPRKVSPQPMKAPPQPMESPPQPKKPSRQKTLVIKSSPPQKTPPMKSSPPRKAPALRSSSAVTAPAKKSQPSTASKTNSLPVVARMKGRPPHGRGVEAGPAADENADEKKSSTKATAIAKSSTKTPASAKSKAALKADKSKSTNSKLYTSKPECLPVSITESTGLIPKPATDTIPTDLIRMPITGGTKGGLSTVSKSNKAVSPNKDASEGNKNAPTIPNKNTATSPNKTKTVTKRKLSDPGNYTSSALKKRKVSEKLSDEGGEPKGKRQNNMIEDELWLQRRVEKSRLRYQKQKEQKKPTEEEERKVKHAEEERQTTEPQLQNPSREAVAKRPHEAGALEAEKEKVERKRQAVEVEKEAGKHAKAQKERIGSRRFTSPPDLLNSDGFPIAHTTAGYPRIGKRPRSPFDARSSLGSSASSGVSTGSPYRRLSPGAISEHGNTSSAIRPFEMAGTSLLALSVRPPAMQNAQAASFPPRIASLSAWSSSAQSIFSDGRGSLINHEKASPRAENLSARSSVGTFNTAPDSIGTVSGARGSVGALNSARDSIGTVKGGMSKAEAIAKRRADQARVVQEARQRRRNSDRDKRNSDSKSSQGPGMAIPRDPYKTSVFDPAPRRSKRLAYKLSSASSASEDERANTKQFLNAAPVKDSRPTTSIAPNNRLTTSGAVSSSSDMQMQRNVQRQAGNSSMQMPARSSQTISSSQQRQQPSSANQTQQRQQASGSSQAVFPIKLSPQTPEDVHVEENSDPQATNRPLPQHNFRPNQQLGQHNQQQGNLLVGLNQQQGDLLARQNGQANLLVELRQRVPPLGVPPLQLPRVSMADAWAANTESLRSKRRRKRLLGKADQHGLEHPELAEGLLDVAEGLITGRRESRKLDRWGRDISMAPASTAQFSAATSMAPTSSMTSQALNEAAFAKGTPSGLNPSNALSGPSSWNAAGASSSNAAGASSSSVAGASSSNAASLQVMGVPMQSPSSSCSLNAVPSPDLSPGIDKRIEKLEERKQQRMKFLLSAELGGEKAFPACHFRQYKRLFAESMATSGSTAEELAVAREFQTGFTIFPPELMMSPSTDYDPAWAKTCQAKRQKIGEAKRRAVEGRPRVQGKFANPEKTLPKRKPGRRKKKSLPQSASSSEATNQEDNPATSSKATTQHTATSLVAATSAAAATSLAAGENVQKRDIDVKEESKSSANSKQRGRKAGEVDVNATSKPRAKGKGGIPAEAKIASKAQSDAAGVDNHVSKPGDGVKNADSGKDNPGNDMNVDIPPRRISLGTLMEAQREKEAEEEKKAQKEALEAALLQGAEKASADAKRNGDANKTTNNKQGVKQDYLSPLAATQQAIQLQVRLKREQVFDMELAQDSKFMLEVDRLAEACERGQLASVKQVYRMLCLTERGDFPESEIYAQQLYGKSIISPKNSLSPPGLLSPKGSLSPNGRGSMSPKRGSVSPFADIDSPRRNPPDFELRSPPQLQSGSQKLERDASVGKKAEMTRTQLMKRRIYYRTLVNMKTTRGNTPVGHLLLAVGEKAKEHHVTIGRALFKRGASAQLPFGWNFRYNTPFQYVLLSHAFQTNSVKDHEEHLRAQCEDWDVDEVVGSTSSHPGETTTQNAGCIAGASCSTATSSNDITNVPASSAPVNGAIRFPTAVVVDGKETANDGSKRSSNKKSTTVNYMKKFLKRHGLEDTNVDLNDDLESSSSSEIINYSEVDIDDGDDPDDPHDPPGGIPEDTSADDTSHEEAAREEALKDSEFLKRWMPIVDSDLLGKRPRKLPLDPRSSEDEKASEEKASAMEASNENQSSRDISMTDANPTQASSAGAATFTASSSSAGIPRERANADTDAPPSGPSQQTAKAGANRDSSASNANEATDAGTNAATNANTTRNAATNSIPEQLQLQHRREDVLRMRLVKKVQLARHLATIWLQFLELFFDYDPDLLKHVSASATPLLPKELLKNSNWYRRKWVFLGWYIAGKRRNELSISSCVPPVSELPAPSSSAAAGSAAGSVSSGGPATSSAATGSAATASAFYRAESSQPAAKRQRLSLPVAEAGEQQHGGELLLAGIQQEDGSSARENVSSSDEMGMDDDQAIADGISAMCQATFRQVLSYL